MSTLTSRVVLAITATSIFVVAVIGCGEQEERANNGESVVEEETIGRIIPGRYEIDFSVVESTCTPGLEEMRDELPDWPWEMVGLSITEAEGQTEIVGIPALRLRSGSLQYVAREVLAADDVLVGPIGEPLALPTSYPMSNVAGMACLESLSNASSAEWELIARPSGELSLVIHEEWYGFQECSRNELNEWAPRSACKETYEFRFSKLITECPRNCGIDTGNRSFSSGDFTYRVVDWSKPACRNCSSEN